MSAFQDLAAPAPTVETAAARPAANTDEINVAPAMRLEETAAKPAQPAEPAVLFDNPKQFAPPMTPEEASQLSVEALRSGYGAEFESEAAIIQGPAHKDILKRMLPIFYDERDFVAYGEVLRYIFVKGNCILVYGEALAPQPLYAIQIPSVTAVQENPLKPDKYSHTISPRINTSRTRQNLVTILLKDKKSLKIKYQVTFDTTNDKSLPKRFMDVFARNSKYYGDEILTATVIPEDGKKK